MKTYDPKSIVVKFGDVEIKGFADVPVFHDPPWQESRMNRVLPAGSITFTLVGSGPPIPRFVGERFDWCDHVGRWVSRGEHRRRHARERAGK